MNTQTLGSLKSTVARVLGISTTDSRVADVINESQERMIQKGDWTGVFLRYVVCVSDGCLVWPRQLETIEAMGICNTPGTVRNEWFEFLGTGRGLQDSDTSIGNQMIDRGSSPTFDTIQTTGKKVRVYAMSTLDAGKKIVLRYYNSSAQKVYSSISGAWQEGEQLVLVAPPAYAISSAEVLPGGLYGVVKDVTTNPVILYEYNVATAANTKTLAQYEPQEQLPNYRVSFIPGLQNWGGCNSSSTCTKTKVTVLARLRHIPVVVDNDPLVIGSRAAFKLMALSIKEEESNNDQAAVSLEVRALRELEFELQAHLGQGAVVQVRMVAPDLYGGGGVNSLVGGSTYRW